MKKLAACLIFILFLFGGCSENTEPMSENAAPVSGFYFAESDSETIMVSYLRLDTQARTYQLGGSPAMSFAYQGEYLLDGTTLTAAEKYSDIDELRFSIVDEKTLILQTSVFSLPAGTKFVYSEDLQ